MGSPPSALGLLGPARAGVAGRLARGARWFLGAQRWPEPRRALAALALATLDATWAAELRPSLSGLLSLLGSLACLAVLGGLLARRFMAVVLGLALLGAEYLACQAGRPVSVVVAAAFAASLLAVGELAWWSAELSARSLWGRRELRRRWAVTTALVGLSFALGTVVGMAGVTRLGPPAVVAGAGGLGGLVAALVVGAWVREIAAGSPGRSGRRGGSGGQERRSPRG